MRRLGFSIGALALASMSTFACGHGASREALSPGAEFGQHPVCGAFSPLVDLKGSMNSTATFGSSSELLPLVDIDQELGYLHLARTRLKGVPGQEAQSLDSELGQLVDVMEARRAKIEDAVTRLEKTYETLEQANDAAAVCKGVDIRDPYLAPGTKKKMGDAGDLPSDAKGEAIRKTNLTTLASPACESAVRLWSSAKSADFSSDVALSALAAHMTELTLDKDRAGIRDRLATAMKDHATALRTLHTIASPTTAERDANVEAYIAQRIKVLKDIDAVRLTCLSAMQTTAHVVGGSGEPRRVTVTVKPKWGSLDSLNHAVEFGSGFVVRWQTADGKTETRIVTNNHVMDGAFEAEIISSDPEFANKHDDKSKNADDDGWSATLIQASPHEDVAILRLDPKAVKFSQGVRFRLKPAAEQEQVVAAGFPGVGVRPSFQVTRGIVSNAKFGDDDADDDTYVQHTAAIDPGNSGGPLLDGDGQLLGMNTMKIVGRENVGLAVPTSQIQQAMIRAEEKATFDIKHAQASCNAVLGALASANPVSDSMSRFGIAIFDANKDADDGKAANYRAAVQGSADNPVEEARLRAYGVVRAMVEAEGGVRPFEVCSKLTVVDGPGASGRRFLSTIHTRTKDHVLVLGEENAAIRLVEVR